MAFERYLSDEDMSHASLPQASGSMSAPYSQYAHYDSLGASSSSSSFSSIPLQFQMPHYILSGQPILAPGGGAEVMGFNHNNYLKYNDRSYQTSKLSSYSELSDAVSIPAAPPSRPFEFREENQTSSLTTSSHTPLSPRHVASNLRPPLPQMTVAPARSIKPPPTNGLPVYSASGFDMLSILARIHQRPDPKIALGPVDFTTSFVVADVRRYDSPIVYASPTFYQLTRYAEHEVIGRNCRFLQAPDGRVEKGEQRRYTAPEAVAHIKKSLLAGKECQASLINFRKGGDAFMNLITIVPLMDENNSDEIVYLVGFQVDLTDQPNAILQKLRDGTYVVDYSTSNIPPAIRTLSGGLDISSRPRRSDKLSKELRHLLSSPSFLRSIQTSVSTVEPNPSEPMQTLNTLLLGHSPDFVHVLSLKGAFLYVAPSVRRVLGYAPEELIGKSVAEYCHSADLVPLMRELKEASLNSVASAPPGGAFDVYGQVKTVDLLFRAKRKDGRYVWMECRGRLYVEPGKGRKAIMVSGRARAYPQLTWGSVALAGGLAGPVVVRPSMNAGMEEKVKEEECEEEEKEEREFWGMVSAEGTFLVVGDGVRDVLGWSAYEMIGCSLSQYVVTDSGITTNTRKVVMDAVARASTPRGGEERQKVCCAMVRKDNVIVDVEVVIYHSQDQDMEAPTSSSQSLSRTPQSLPLPLSPIILQVKLRASPTSSSPQHSHSQPPTASHPPSSAGSTTVMRQHASNVFEELDIERNSSWQYELQQLKYANKRLKDEVVNLEDALQRQRRGSVQGQSEQQEDQTMPSHPGLANTIAQPLAYPAMAMDVDVDGDNITALQSSSRKRSWDSRARYAPTAPS